MKFSEKIIWSCLVVLAIMFSMGSLFMIYTNYQTLLETTLQQYLSNHQVELYTLESRLFQDGMELETYYGKNMQKMYDKMIYYV